MKRIPLAILSLLATLLISTISLASESSDTLSGTFLLLLSEEQKKYLLVTNNDDIAYLVVYPDGSLMAIQPSDNNDTSSLLRTRDGKEVTFTVGANGQIQNAHYNNQLIFFKHYQDYIDICVTDIDGTVLDFNSVDKQTLKFVEGSQYSHTSSSSLSIAPTSIEYSSITGSTPSPSSSSSASHAANTKEFLDRSELAVFVLGNAETIKDLVGTSKFANLTPNYVATLTSVVAAIVENQSDNDWVDALAKSVQIGISAGMCAATASPTSCYGAITSSMSNVVEVVDLIIDQYELSEHHETMEMLFEERNADKDGDGRTPFQGDCNDNDPTIYRTAPEVCEDGIDQDCSGEDLPCCGNGLIDACNNCTVTGDMLWNEEGTIDGTHIFSCLNSSDTTTIIQAERPSDSQTQTQCSITCGFSDTACELSEPKWYNVTNTGIICDSQGNPTEYGSYCYTGSYSRTCIVKPEIEPL